MSTSKQVRDNLADKQDELGKVFAEAKTDDGQLDFNLVKCLGDDVKGSVAVADKVRQMNAELDDLGKEAEALESAEKAAKEHADREKAASRITHPNDERKGDGFRKTKSLGATITEENRYIDWAKTGSGGGLTFSYPEMYPSDMMSKSGTYETLGAKTLFETTAGWAPESLRLPGFVEAVTRPIQLIDIIPLAQTGFEQIVYMEETTRTHAAAETAEGATFKESTFVLTERTSNVRKITDTVIVTDEQLADVAQVNSYLNGRLLFGLRQRLDLQVLVGAGTGILLDGIKNVTGIQTQAKGGDPTPDAFFKAMTKIRLTGRAQPTHHIIHPTDWEQIRLLRTADGLYIWGNPSEAGVERMWGLPVVQSDADSAGTGYVGSFQPAWISLFERQGIDVQVGFVGSQFAEGKRTIRADMRFAFVLFRPAAFSTVTGI